MIDQTQIYTWREACQHVIRSCPNPYAKSYAQASLEITDPYMIQVQALYILSNTTHWRGDLAKAVKMVLRWYAKPRKVSN